MGARPGLGTAPDDGASGSRGWWMNGWGAWGVNGRGPPLAPPQKSIPPRRLNLGAKCGPFLRGPAPEGNAPTPVIGFNMWHPITSTRSVIVIGLRGGVVLLGGVCLSTPGGVDFSLTEKKKTTGSPGPPNLQFPSALCTNVEMIIKLFFFFC